MEISIIVHTLCVWRKIPKAYSNSQVKIKLKTSWQTKKTQRKQTVYKTYSVF